MKVIKHSLKAFTIMEMLINMVIMSIIIGMVYYAYSSFAKQISYFQISVQKEINLDTFLLQLKTDFFKAEKIVQTNASNSFEVTFYNDNKINYTIKNNSLLRTQNSNVDSLLINKIYLETTTNPINQEKLVQKTTIICSLFNEPIEFVVTKNYPTIIEYGN